MKKSHNASALRDFFHFVRTKNCSFKTVLHLKIHTIYADRTRQKAQKPRWISSFSTQLWVKFLDFKANIPYGVSPFWRIFWRIPRKILARKLLQGSVSETPEIPHIPCPCFTDPITYGSSAIGLITKGKTTFQAMRRRRY